MRCEGYIVWRVQNCITVNFYTMVSRMNRYIIKNDEMEEVEAGKKGPSTTDVPLAGKYGIPLRPHCSCSPPA